MAWWQDRARRRSLWSVRGALRAGWAVLPSRRQAAQSLVEVCLLLAFVAILLIGILSITGKTVSCSLEPLDNGLASGQTSPGNSGNAPGHNKGCNSNAGGNNGGGGGGGPKK